MAPWQDYIAEHQPRFLDELIEFLRIPSISALPEHAADVQHAAEWVAERLERIGIEHVQVLPTGGHPVVYGDWLHAGDQPTVMIYGHFDVQPVDPLTQWHHPPFAPHIEGDRIYARGATDDKGNMLAPILAIEALLATDGALPVNVKFFFEGQEEIGSPQLAEMIAQKADLLACDMVLSADGGQWSETEPALLMGLRGICGVELDVVGPEHDLHSGTFGGAVQNPLHALAHILASMRSAEGKIMVKGFYDGVVELSAAEREALAKVPYDEAEYKAELGVEELFGEPGYTTRERTWVRPTLEVNGMWGGFQGEGNKTVLPAEAHAKITCRLAPHQDPVKVMDCIEEHVRRHTLPGVTVTVRRGDHGTRPYLIPADHPGNQAARQVLQRLYSREPYPIYMGGTIPVTPLFREHLDAYSVVFSFGLHDERTHSPNEFYRLSSFRKAQTAYAMLLEELAKH